MTLEDWTHGHTERMAQDPEPSTSVSGVETPAPRDSYEERWLNVLSKGNPQKKDILRGLPLTTVALYGMAPFRAPNGNKGKPYAGRNFNKEPQ